MERQCLYCREERELKYGLITMFFCSPECAEAHELRSVGGLKWSNVLGEPSDKRSDEK